MSADVAPVSAQDLPAELMIAGRTSGGPVANAAFYPPEGARAAPPLTGRLVVAQTRMSFEPRIPQAVCDGAGVEMGGSCRGGFDKRLLPGFSLDVFTVGDRLAAGQVGEILGEGAGGTVYWKVIPQYGRVWHQEGDGDWFRAAFPLMLVHDIDNHAHQGLASFLYRGDEVTDLRFQFVQQTAPWNVPVHFVAWGVANAAFYPQSGPQGGASSTERRAQVERELATRLPFRPWSELLRGLADEGLPTDVLAGFGGSLPDDYVAAMALLRDGVLYAHASHTPQGPYPYPEEMRFGPRSVAKSVTAPLALGRLAQVYGPEILELKIGDYVAGLDPEYGEVRFIDAANMATGMGGQGSLVTEPNDPNDGYVDETYDDWYNGAFSAAEKIDRITRDASPYPWDPGVVMRYRDRDYHLLGAATDGFLKSVRGPGADIWEMLRDEVLTPIGVHHAPIVRTREPDGTRGLPWFHAGIYPTLDDLAKIFTLYQQLGEHAGEQLLHRSVVEEIFTVDQAMPKTRSLSSGPTSGEELYEMGFHLTPFTDPGSADWVYVPGSFGFGGNQVLMYPKGVISIRMAKAWPCDACEGLGGPEETIAAVRRLLRTLARP